MKQVFDKLYKMRLVASNREAEESLEVRRRKLSEWSNQQSYEQGRKDAIDACISILIEYLEKNR